MLIDELKKQALEAAKRRDDVAKSILRLALGELQTAEARTNRALSDEEGYAVLRKLVKANEETLALTTDDARKAVLQQETAVLQGLLPAALGLDQIVAALAPVHDAIKAAKGEGPATGIAMKHAKASGLQVGGNDVAAAVKAIRG
jgi:uncharacterized protein YqeY